MGALVVVTVCGMMAAAWDVASTRHAAAPLPDYGRVPDFSLTDQQGRAVTRQTLDGSVWIADFIFSRCAGQCPLLSQRMAGLQAQLDGVQGLRLISITVDPAYDTPEVLATYAHAYGATAGRWQFLTGDPELIRVLVQEGFHLGIGTDGTPREPITHSVRLVLVDAAGHIRGYYDAMESGLMPRLQADARRLLHDAHAS